MRILITNDDGIEADGLLRLCRCAAGLGEVWIVAPALERSAASHSITLRTHIDIYPYDYPIEGVKAFSCSGTPGDCIRVGIPNVMDEKPDLILSGINRGYNVASDIQYSATCGAAFEAEFLGYRAIALSEGMNGTHEVTDAMLSEIMSEVVEYEPRDRQIINVNFPDCPLSEYKGILRDRTVSHGSIFHDVYHPVENLKDGGIRYTVEGTPGRPGEPGSDLDAVMSGYISIGYAHNIH